MVFDKFQSTPPARGATSSTTLLTLLYMISIHAPREGGDDYSQETKTDILGISIHTPREGGDVEGSKLWFNCNPISIHAPREGGDAAESTAKKLGLIFQSTPPARGATQ